MVSIRISFSKSHRQEFSDNCPSPHDIRIFPGCNQISLILWYLLIIDKLNRSLGTILHLYICQTMLIFCATIAYGNCYYLNTYYQTLGWPNSLETQLYLSRLHRLTLNRCNFRKDFNTVGLTKWQYKVHHCSTLAHRPTKCSDLPYS